MLLHEFEELMGNACTEEVFNGKINPLYMMTDMDKRDFCDDYKLHGHSRIMDEVCEHALKVEHQLNAANKLIAELQQKITLAAERLIFISDDMADDDSYKMAVDLVGQNYVTTFRVRENIDLNNEDRQYILNHLA